MRPTPAPAVDAPTPAPVVEDGTQDMVSTPDVHGSAAVDGPVPHTNGVVNANTGAAAGSAPAPSNGHAASDAKGASNGNGALTGDGGQHSTDDRSSGCTAPQLRRFIKSRPYVPMHELRRRFAIDGGEDEVTQVLLDGGNIYVGLPAREGSLLGELLRGGEIGYELSFDPRAPIVVGVYPMRPVPRP